MVLTALLALLAAAPAAGQQSVAALKLSPAEARGRMLVLQGEVVEVRGLSPRSLQGFYRLLDGTDPDGVLIRTNDLPTSGGPFRIEARLSPEVLRDGLLLLDETGRRELGAWQWWIALALAGLGLLALGAIATLYGRAARDERRRRLAPPLWLIPAEQGPSAPRPAGDLPEPARIDLDADEDERLELEVLATRKQRVLRWTAPAGLVAAVGIAWAGGIWWAEAGQPSFVLLEPVGTGAFVSAVPSMPDTVAGAPAPTPAVDAPPELAVVPVPDTARPRPALPTPFTTPPVTAPAPKPAEAPQRVAELPGPTPTPAPVAPAPVVVTAPPAPAEQPAPEPPRPDPATLRRLAERELEGGIGRFVAAVAGKQPVSAATLYASGDARRAKFLEFLTQYQPEAAMLGAEPSTVGETSAEAVFRLTFRWRGNFGVAQRKDARFIATARRAGDSWDFQSIRLLENLP